ncbi:MAG: hypothetical protein GEU94_20925 [Micromonosporaceae bacterium]|nr:hypothetical protein [Micromonosporaceae bacterium]
MSTELLPVGAYLAWWYVDSHFGVTRSQIYYEDGRVEALEGDERTELCRFTSEQVAAARQAVVSSGLPASADSPADQMHDAAPLTYAWRLGGEEGSVSNVGYPATRHDAIDRLEAALADLEEDAGCWPVMADE